MYSTDIAFFLRYVGGGGAERVILNLIQKLAEMGLKVDLVLAIGGGPFIKYVCPKVRIIDLKAPRLAVCLPKLVKYLKNEQPKTLLSTLHYNNEFAILAKIISGTSTRVIVREANTVSRQAEASSQLKKRLIPIFIRYLYPFADGIIAVSQGVANDLAQITGLPKNRFRVIYNPTIVPDLLEKMKEPIDHPWFNQTSFPIVLGVGKLQEQKDFPTLIYAFAQVRKIREAKLVILGWGPDRPKLEALIHELGLEGDVMLLGHVNNPYAYMAHSNVFALSSLWEGLPNVLIEAMATGVPVISTNCESGPSEILDNGKYGHLIPVGNSQALAEKILSALDSQAPPIPADWLSQFTVDHSTQEYLNMLGLT